MFLNQGTSKRSASTSIGDIKPGFGSATPTDMGEQASACDMAWACEELDDAQLATVVGGLAVDAGPYRVDASGNLIDAAGDIFADAKGNILLGRSPINVSL